MVEIELPLLSLYLMLCPLKESLKYCDAIGVKNCHFYCYPSQFANTVKPVLSVCSHMTLMIIGIVMPKLHFKSKMTSIKQTPNYRGGFYTVPWLTV